MLSMQKVSCISIFLITLFYASMGFGQSYYVAGKYTGSSNEEIDYYLYFPKDYDKNSQRKYPILLFLHGGGEAYDYQNSGTFPRPPKLIEEGQDFPFIILAPFNPHAKKWWNVDAVMKVLQMVTTTHAVDEKRIYLSGLSRGGSAAWEMVVNYPDTFAALAVVCGMAPAPYASWIDQDLPIWIFHGEEDKVIPISESEEMIKKLSALGHQVKFTRYKGVGHNAWDKAYRTPELYSWLVEQHRD